MEKIYYDDNVPIETLIRELAALELHKEMMENVVLYTLHKGGMLEDGMPLTQFYEAFGGFLEVMTHVSKSKDYAKFAK